MRWSTITTFFLGIASFVAAIDPVEVSGNKFFNKDGSQFFIKGTCTANSEGFVLDLTDFLQASHISCDLLIRSLIPTSVVETRRS